MEKYTTKEVANLFNVSDRAIVKRCKNAKVKMVNGKYLVPQKVLDTWMYKRNAKNQNKTAIRTKTEVPMQVPNEAQVKNLSEHQNIALQNKVETLEKELLNYRKVLDVHSRIFKTIFMFGVICRVINSCDVTFNMSTPVTFWRDVNYGHV